MDYYSKSNSYMNEVIDDREGIPITMAVLYMELARRVGVNVVGVGLPGHFLARHEPKEGPGTLIDVYEGAKELTRAQAVAMVTDSGREFDDEYLATQSKQKILIRMLRNLMGIAQKAGDAEAMLQYTESVLILDPASAEDRWFRAVLYYQTERREEALADVEWLIEREPPGVDLARVKQLREILTENVKP
jgi:regulator of sirC expression with transglutaminase-like and TPR domain